MTKNKKDLIESARNAGFEIRYDDEGAVYIRKRYANGKISRGLVIYADGTAIDLTLDLSVAKGIRSYKTMRGLLKLAANSARD